VDSKNLAGLLPRVASLVFNKPMMLEEYKLAEIASVLASYRGVDISAVDIEALRVQHGVSSKTVRAEYELVGGSLALIPIEGTLVHKAAGLDALSGLMSYKDIEGMFNAALDDGRVEQIAFMVKSPGGDVQGVFDLAEVIFQARGTKPIAAIVDETAASAAYLLAAATSRIFVPQTAVVGSIGVVARLENHTKWNERRGIDVEYIHAGRKKVLGNPDTPLTDEARKEVSAQVAEVYEIFVTKAAQYTGISESQVRGTEAGVYTGAAAVQIGLATDQMSVNEAIETLLNTNKRKTTMSGKVNATFTQDQVDVLVNEAKIEAHACGVAEGIETGMKTEQERVSAILAVESSGSHMALVGKAIANPKFNAEDVKDLMAAMPTLEVTKLEVAPDQLALEMGNIQNPDVGTDNGDAPAEDSVDTMAQMIINAGKSA